MAPIIPIEGEGEALCIGILEEGNASLPILDLAATVKPHLGSALGSRLDLIGQVSLFNLATAITAMHIGVPGRLTIEVPSRVGDRIEVDWQPASRTTQDE